ncbi:MogA/MoaB family molybdenum cofactor biosynthesis protein [Helcobacillus massiliensis]|uniref:Molybdenum cofactor biosynthesis protein B n=1 Tax=Helcobacillus massiliensis TaxID=521392 RepID=A0A839QRZ8_9MICO|nr:MULTISPECIES: MogA/MoaB family molybdenum cofactor biosynthesis protein [Helcobacillus]MBB3023084.1 molybdenum cofactor biosynthesis protein B [Helcobacillus massiliensis]MCG7426097.1 MogA/MoaB family molybdenum cofactor biosynthesis protein [Helcobacillus sp. ACRRO]MCT1558737.1 MogA/MoaB family molybdenum cofactor biosynthesis protein [Helcobacillus massiliensis]MCT2037463.1 MogA/MoaB family molybdenum cofactor biosynthesis protein [Helcobacillus massiliensis]MCT2332971.1 MogA/MoaB family 
MTDHPFTAQVIIASTRAADGTYEDRTGPILTDWLTALGWTVPERVIVPDGPEVGEQIGRALQAGADVIITSGGTGISPSDVTPEQTAPYLERQLPGIPEAIRHRGLDNTPLAAISRGLAGLNGRTLIVNLPGSRGGVRDGMVVLEPMLAHLMEQRDGGGHE